MSHTLINKFPKAAPYLVCFTAALFFAFELMQLHMMNAIAPMCMKDLNLSATGFGVLSSTYLLADVIFLIPAGMILDRVPIKKVIVSAMLLCILGTFGLSLAPNLAVASMAHFVSGIGNAFCFLSLVMLISTWFPQAKHASMIGMVITIGMFGGFVAQSPFSALAGALSWRVALMVDGLIGVGILFLVLLLVHDKEGRQVQASMSVKQFFSDFSACLTSRQNITCGLYTCFMNMPLMIIGAVYGSLFLTQSYGLSLPQASFVISMICVGTIIGSPIFGFLGDRIRSKKGLMMVSSLASVAVFYFIMNGVSSTLPALIGVFLLLGFVTSAQVLGYPLITESAPSHLVGTSMGVSAVIIMGLPMFVGPLAGSIMDSMSVVDSAGVTHFPLESFHTAFLVFPVGFLLSFLLTLLMKEKRAKVIAAVS